MVRDMRQAAVAKVAAIMVAVLCGQAGALGAPAEAGVCGASSASPVQPKGRLVLLIARFSQAGKCLAAAGLGSLCRRGGVEFDAYWAAEREGGIFSAHGSAIASGRHDLAIARALAQFDTTVVRLGDVRVFESLTRTGARETIAAADVIDLYEAVGRRLGLAVPESAVAVQTRNLPKGLTYMHPYVYPEAVFRGAIAVPLELSAADVSRLKSLGVRQVWTIAAAEADLSVWKAASIDLRQADVLAPADTLHSFTQRMARRWIDRAAAIDVCEPVMAAYLFPLFLREGRLAICSEPTTKDAIDSLPALVAGKTQRTIYNRYGGGPVKGVGDLGLWPLFRAGLSVQVVEPGRPVLTVLASRPAPLPQPARSMFEMEPTDDQLSEWAAEGRILATWVLHSGEMSHDDAVINFIEFSAWRQVPIGAGVHWQRYAMEPWCVEPMHTPREEGGALGLVEPVLHSSGHGILAESAADPGVVVQAMREARQRIAQVAGERFAPRGVYCYCDANPRQWDRPNEALWKAIRQAGFQYVLSSVAHGQNRLLYREGDFVVLNLAGFRMYPNSPFVCVKDTAQMMEVEKRLVEAGKPGWIIGVLDSPIYGYGPYLPVGHKWGNNRRISEFYDFLQAGAKDRRWVLATPHTIARYARLLDDKGLVAR